MYVVLAVDGGPAHRDAAAEVNKSTSHAHGPDKTAELASTAEGIERIRRAAGRIASTAREVLPRRRPRRGR